MQPDATPTRKYAPREPRVRLICEVCASVFFKSASYVRRNPARTCGNDCRHILHRGPIGDHPARFWSRVHKDAPMPWSGAEYGNCWTRDGLSHGYSIFWDGERLVRGTHYAWSLATGEPFPDGMHANHRNAPGDRLL